MGGAALGEGNHRATVEHAGFDLLDGRRIELTGFETPWTLDPEGPVPDIGGEGIVWAVNCYDPDESDDGEESASGGN